MWQYYLIQEDRDEGALESECFWKVRVINALNPNSTQHKLSWVLHRYDFTTPPPTTTSTTHQPHNQQFVSFNDSILSKLKRRPSFDGRWPMMEDKLWWKTTFDGRHPLIEDNLWWKMTFDGRQPLMKDNLWWKTTSEMKTTSNMKPTSIMKTASKIKITSDQKNRRQL